MTVGEIANVRRATVDPMTNHSLFRGDAGVLDDNAADNNEENFVAAVAPLVALSDWVTVRSQVFTVYGVFRGEEDSSITHSDFTTQLKLRNQDVDSRAIRFQETIDRLPTFLGEPLPARIGDRTIARYLDTRND